MKKPHILILSTSGGAGHIRAAEALHRTAQSLGLPVRTEHHDCLDFTSRTFKKIYAGTYLGLVDKTPELWGYFYQMAESKPYKKKGLIGVFDHFNYSRYLRFLDQARPDAIVCTHFLPYMSISNVLRKRKVGTPIFAVTTDFDVHQYWVDPIVFRYYVHNEESSWQLQSKGIPASRIRIAGIPVMPEFIQHSAKRQVRRKLGLDPSTFTVLVLSGGFGVGRVEQIVDVVSATLATQARRQFSLVVVCGKNQKTQTLLQRKAYPSNVAASIFGFVTNMDEMMSASDILVSKSGGLTSAEALVKGLPMIIVDPIPGQETRNADLIIEHGAGWKAINLSNLAYKLNNVLQDPSLLADAHNKTRQLARPNAARDILNDVIKHLSLNEEKTT